MKCNLTYVAKNKVILYLLSRYATYTVQFVTSLFIAIELGPYYMGIWGFVLLLLQYFQQFHLGISNSFNILYVHHRDNQRVCNDYIGNSLALICYLSVLVALFYIYYFLVGISEVEKYHAGKYIVWICIIAILQYFVQFFVNLFRVKNQINRVAFCQSIIVFLNFCCVFLFKGKELIDWLIVCYVIGNLLCFVLAITSGSIPRVVNVHFSFDYQKEILKKGFYLFLYNSCFYFIMISIRTIISNNYSIEEFGVFTFSITLASAILLLLEAFSFIVFPKVIGKLSSPDEGVINKTIKLLRTTYITAAHFLIYVVMCIFPILLNYIPKYSNAILAMNLIALTALIGINSFGYLELLLSKNKEKFMAGLSAMALLLNCIFAVILVKCLFVPFSYVILATLVTNLIYTFLVVGYVKKFIYNKQSINLITELMPLRIFVPFSIAFYISIIQIEMFIWIPLLVFVLLNRKQVRSVVQVVKLLTFRPNLVNL